MGLVGLFGRWVGGREEGEGEGEGNRCESKTSLSFSTAPCLVCEYIFLAIFIAHQKRPRIFFAIA